MAEALMLDGNHRVADAGVAIDVDLGTSTMAPRPITTLLTTCGPPQPPHHGTPTKRDAPHHRMTGSPHPSATQPTTGCPVAMATPDPPPKNATSAGAYAGRTTTGPGAQPQKPSTNTQRP